MRVGRHRTFFRSVFVSTRGTLAAGAQLVLFAGCVAPRDQGSSGAGEQTLPPGLAQASGPVSCVPQDVPAPSDASARLAFGIYDDCVGTTQPTVPEFFDQPFARGAPVCRGEKAVEGLALKHQALRFADAASYDAADRVERQVPALGRRIDRFKRRFQWVFVELAEPMACAGGQPAVTSGWLSTASIKWIHIGKGAVTAAARGQQQEPTPTEASALQWPLTEPYPGFLKAQLVSGFGSTGAERRGASLIGRFGPDGAPRRHAGLDFAVPVGTPQLAAGDGTVAAVGFNHRSGWTVWIEHSRESLTLYGHNEEVLVRPGDRVTAGQRISVVGYGGNALLPHVHFGLSQKGTFVDPLRVLPPLSEPVPAAGRPRSASGPDTTAGGSSASASGSVQTRSDEKRIVLWVGAAGISSSVTLDELQSFAAGGRAEGLLATLVQRLPGEDSAERVREFLQFQLYSPFSQADVLAAVEETDFGRGVMELFESLFQRDPERGALGLRSALIASVSQDQTISFLGLLRNYPLPDLNLSLEGISRAPKRLKELLERLSLVNATFPPQ